jgi:hypothetical protein
MVCMCVCMSVYVHARRVLFTRICAYALSDGLRVCMCVCMSVYVHAIVTAIFKYVFMYVCMYVYMSSS